MKDTTNYGYIFPRQLIYFVGPHIFIPRLSGFFYCLTMDPLPLLVVAE